MILRLIVFLYSKESWLYEGTNIDRLIEKLKSGIQVKVNWNEEEEYVFNQRCRS